MGSDSTGNLGASPILGPLEVVVRLETHPKLRCRSEIAGQTERGVCRDRPLATNDVIHPRYRYDQLHRQSVRAQPKRLQKVFPQRFTRVDGRHGLSFFRQGSPSSVIVHNCHIDCIEADPTETDPPLAVDPNAVLPAPIPSKRFKTISRNRSQIRECCSSVQVVQFPFRHEGDPLKPPAELAPKDLLGFRVQEAPNHFSRILLPHI